jgi:hypothetical protein
MLLHFKKYFILSFIRHNIIFIVYEEVLHVSALFIGRHQVIQYVKNIRMYTANYYHLRARYTEYAVLRKVTELTAVELYKVQTELINLLVYRFAVLIRRGFV